MAEAVERGALKVRWSKRHHDHLISYPRSPDGHLIHIALFNKRSAPILPEGGVSWERSLAEELEARGYDLSTLRFEIRLKTTPPPPPASPARMRE